MSPKYVHLKKTDATSWPVEEVSKCVHLKKTDATSWPVEEVSKWIDRTMSNGIRALGMSLPSEKNTSSVSPTTEPVETKSPPPPSA
jgi:hypothetical protein